MIYPGQFSSMYYLIFFSHLFFFFKKSSSERFIKYTTDFAVMNRCVFRIKIYLMFQSPCLTHLFCSRYDFTLFKSAIYSWASLLLVLLTCLSRSSSRLFVNSKSFRTNSLLIISISLTGLTSFSV